MADEYFLAPMQVHVVSQGDDLLWDGASKFVNSDTLRFRVGDSVKCLVADIWVGGAPHVPSAHWHNTAPRSPADSHNRLALHMWVGTLTFVPPRISAALE